MELSQRTMDILKNYATINPNIVVREGNLLKTIAPAKNLFAVAEIDETFDTEFGVYDLNEFLSVLSLVDKPNLEFAKEHLVVSDNAGLSRVKYFYSDPEMLTVPAKDLIMPECEVTFKLDTRTLATLKRAASALGHNEIAVSPSSGSGSVRLSVVDPKDSTSNVFSVDVPGEFEDGVDFNFVVNVNNLKIIGEDYDVGISKKLISNFKSVQSSIEYFIALEKSSTYGS